MAGDAREPVWVSNTDLELDGVTFRAQPMHRFASTRELFCVWKRPDLARRYIEVCQRLQPKAIFELGIFQGGSAALMALLARPDKLVAVDISETRVAGLDELIASRGLGDSVFAHYGIDQGDRATLLRIADEAFGDQPLDLVVDDASHYLELTEASFNALFPRLRPGGKYIVEDWAWAHYPIGSTRPDAEPLTTFVFEALMSIPSDAGYISDIELDRDWAVITRGPGEIDPATYDIRTAYDDRGRSLVVALRDRAGSA